ncbi:UbiA-like polyprenyltransferase [Fonticella tunisiensis]|uniref:4-hydroxybenzoate polyprenyltransferase n=1 Tax=Fonticella tunisiensis TaxID=1096341 RepID=A0A4V6Q2Y9_9CLOT|nr:UbiA-like polyprenyltransferase [Fonticella tunisiensis]TDT60987.1 4-hydroxybenzoate polyprenyltransferase [Fonticella tunisiensis]
MVLKKLKTYGELVMFSHTLFSLPFGLISMFWAADKGLPELRVFFWILVALAGARNGANALNRLVDKNIDAKNPRTAQRHMPRGVVKNYEVIIIVFICFILLTLAAYELNPLCLKLLPIALILFGIYSYTKRFTWACHVILGIACGGAPVGAWIAVKGSIGWPALVLGAVVTLWVAGFDIIYGTQDVDFDRREGLYSIPAVFGVKNALIISTLFHISAVILLIYLGFYMNMGWLYALGLCIISVLLFMEHIMVKPDNLKNVKIASYSINQTVSVVLLMFTALDIFILR